MNIDNVLLAHVNDFFGAYNYRLCVSPEIDRGIYFIAPKLKTIYYDSRLLYFNRETQYMIIIHAILMYGLFNSSMNRIEQLECADKEAVQKACEQFPAFSTKYFIGIIVTFLLRHSIEFDTERVNRIRKYIDHDFKIRKRFGYSENNQDVQRL